MNNNYYARILTQFSLVLFDIFVCAFGVPLSTISFYARFFLRWQQRAGGRGRYYNDRGHLRAGQKA